MTLSVDPIPSPIEPPADAPEPAGSRPLLRSIQVGMSWFAERPGGLDRYFAGLLANMRSAGMAARGFVIGSPGVTADSRGLVEAVAAPGERIWVRWHRARQAVARAIRTDAPSLVAVHHALYGFPAVWAMGRLPLVVHFHGPYAAECNQENDRRLANYAKARMERSVYRRGRRCVVLSRAFARVLRDDYGISEGLIRVVPGGIDAARFDLPVDRADARRRLGWPTDRPVLFSVRRLFRRMGLENLIAAAEVARRSVPDLLVMIAGKGWYGEQLQKQIDERGLNEHVKLIGFVPDEQLPLAYRAADLTVVPTVALEGFGLTTAESLAAGTPAIVTPVGGSPEVVAELSSDLIVGAATPEALADHFVAALKDQLDLPDADACRRHVREKFDWPVVVERIRSVYEEVL